MLLKVEINHSKPGSSWSTSWALPVQWEMVVVCCENVRDAVWVAWYLNECNRLFVMRRVAGG